MLINVKKPITVGILTFMSMINFVLNWVEHGKSFITSVSGTHQDMLHYNISSLQWEPEELGKGSKSYLYISDSSTVFFS